MTGRRTRTPEIETMQIPHEYAALADRRLAAIIRRCCFDDNIVESVARSCYLQGIVDGAQVAAGRPDVMRDVMRAIQETEKERRHL